ncbi:hypothetical protein C8R44DRAFT_917012 [Mycena epipterygia]|nr:hypothetical protein C8R44DRAFT_917012 [Mycena epipterygia]
MPHDPTATKIRLTTIISCLTPAVTILNELHDGFGTPFVQAISSTTLSLILTAQNVKRNKDQVMQLMESIHAIIYAIVNLHIVSEPVGSLSPGTLDHVGKFAETLRKIHVFVEAQHDGNKIKHFFRQSEMSTLLKECRKELEHALDVFKIERSVPILTDIASIQKKTETMQQELLELISNLSEDTVSDKSSSQLTIEKQMYLGITSSQNSSTSFSMLPARPKIFNGREFELLDIVEKLNSEHARIPILGTGGIGKTSLAKAVMHHPHVAAKYEQRLFIAADSATTSVELAALTGSHLGLKPGKDLTKPVVQHLSRGPPCLVVLDNLETPWEPLESRGGVEEFLSLLTDIPHLALIITMRGAERPAKVRWTRPFLEPLKPLTDDAARQTFIEIADDCHDSKDIDQLLLLTNNMPLAVNLIAHLVDYEGCSNVLARWETERTSLLSESHDKKSNLDASIAISLSSPRMTSCPGAKDLLSLLSILPDGLSDIELVQCDLPIQDLLRCRAQLLCTSLAYYDANERLKSLVPIREHIQCFYPPSPQLFHPLCKYFNLIMYFYEKYRGVYENSARINQITANLGNLQQLLLLELHPENPDLVDVIYCTTYLNAFCRLTGHGCSGLMDHVPTVLLQLSDHHVALRYNIEVLEGMYQHPIKNPEVLIDKVKAQFCHLSEPALESRFYTAIGSYYQGGKNDRFAARQSFEKALSLAKSCGDLRQHSIAVDQIAWLKYRVGDYSAAQMDAHEAQQIAHMSGNLYQEALTLRTKAVCLATLGNLEEAVPLYQRARELLKLCGMQGGHVEHNVMVDLAEVHLLKSEYLEAHSIHSKLVQEISVEQNPHFYALALFNIAEIGVLIGEDVLEVQKNLDSSRSIFSTLGGLQGQTQCDMVLADLNLREGNMIAAKHLLKQCLNTAWGNDPDTVSYCLERLADVRHWIATKNSAYVWSTIYLAQAQKTQEKLALHKALRFLGDDFSLQGDKYTAHNLFVATLEGFTSMHIHRSRADCMIRLGDIAMQSGNLVKAVDLWKEARPLFERSSQVKDIAQIDS